MNIGAITFLYIYVQWAPTEDRLDNLYFAFLFTLRAVVKAGDNLMAFPYDTGFSDEDQATRKMIAQLVNAPLPEHFLRELDSGASGAASIGGSDTGGATGGSERPDSKLIHEAHQEMKEDIQECRTGFNERELFQVPKGYHGAAYWEKVGESEALEGQLPVEIPKYYPHNGLCERVISVAYGENCKFWAWARLFVSSCRATKCSQDRGRFEPPRGNCAGEYTPPVVHIGGFCQQGY